MEINLLLRLLIAHLLTDFVLQPGSWVKDKEEKQGKSVKLYLHVAVTAIAAYILSGRYDNWVIPVVIFITHLIIDFVKSKSNKDKFSYFIVDQLAHLAVIILLWLSTDNIWPAIGPSVNAITSNNKLWIITAGYLFISWPLGMIIGKATQKWRDQINRENAINQPENNDEQELGLASAGKWIGICERVLILTFVIMAQYTAIGFLMTAKSILRFSEKEANTQLKTEYVLVGTLVSFASSAMIGILISLILNS